jgi:hypothetical protein
MAAKKEEIIEKLRRIIFRRGKGSGFSGEWFEEPYQETET